MDPGFAELDITLRDGRVVHLRTVHPQDEAELLQAFERRRRCPLHAILALRA
jgi:hypothetical protein